MKKFKHWLNEAPTTDAEASELDDHTIKPPGKYDREESIGHTGEHDIITRSWKGKENNERYPAYHYLAVHDKDDVVHMSVRGVNVDKHFIAN